MKYIDSAQKLVKMPEDRYKFMELWLWIGISLYSTILIALLLTDLICYSD
jgi:hypothetical protein